MNSGSELRDQRHRRGNRRVACGSNMIPREGGNRWSGDFKAVNRPGRLAVEQPDRSAHQQNGLDRRQRRRSGDRLHLRAIGGPIMRDRLWIFSSARYFSVNNFIANTFMDDGSQGIDDQFIKNVMTRVTWQVLAAQQALGVLRRDRQVPRPRHAERTTIRRRRRRAVELTGVSHDRDQMDFAGDQRAVSRGWVRRTTLEYYTNSYQEGIEKPRGIGRLVCDRRQETSSTSAATPRPVRPTPRKARWRYYWNAAATYVKGDHSFKAGITSRQGNFKHTREANADLDAAVPQQQHRRALRRCPTAC